MGFFGSELICALMILSRQYLMYDFRLMFQIELLDGGPDADVVSRYERGPSCCRLRPGDEGELGGRFSSSRIRSPDRPPLRGSSCSYRSGKFALTSGTIAALINIAALHNAHYLCTDERSKRPSQGSPNRCC